MVDSNAALQVKCKMCGAQSPATSMRMSAVSRDMICPACFAREKERESAMRNVSRG